MLEPFDPSGILIPNDRVQSVEYELIRRMEFNSDRKRMSALVIDPKDKLIKLLVKGADSIILSRLDPN